MTTVNADSKKIAMAALVAAVKEYANDHYDEDGWDFIVECYGDAELEELLGGARSVKTAIAKCHKTAKTQGDHRTEIQASGY